MAVNLKKVPSTPGVYKFLRKKFKNLKMLLLGLDFPFLIGTPFAWLENSYKKLNL